MSSVFDEGYAEQAREDADLYLGPPGWDYPPEPDDEDESDEDERAS